MVWQPFFSVTLAFSIPFSFLFVMRFGETDGMSACFFLLLALLTFTLGRQVRIWVSLAGGGLALTDGGKAGRE